MHKIACWLAFALAALSLVGCRAKTDPAYSPDGKTIAYVDSQQNLFLNSGAERKFAGGIEGDVAWNEDGTELAFFSRGKTYVANTANGRRRVVPRITFPYAWNGNSLIGLYQFQRKNEFALLQMNIATGEVTRKLYLGELAPPKFVRAGGLLLFGGKAVDLSNLSFARTWTGEDKYPIDGSTQEGIDIGELADNLLLIDKGRGRVERVAFEPSPGIAFDLLSAKRRNGTLVVELLTVIPPANDRAKLENLIEGGALRNGASNAKEVEAILRRSDFKQVLYAAVEGAPLRIIVPRKLSERSAVSYDLSPDGREIAISDGDSLTKLPLDQITP